jgi:hypothetical protein
MPASLAFVAQAASLGLLGTLEAVVGGDLEANAGTAPIQPTAPSLPFVGMVGTPRLELRLTRPRREATAHYNPRLFWRKPNAADLDRPIYLHQGGIEHTSRLSRRLTLRDGILAAQGELDYMATNLAFGPAQGAQLDIAIIDFYSVEAFSELTAELDRRHQLVMRVSGGESGPSEPGPLPTLRRVGVTPELQMKLAPRDTLAFQLMGESLTFDGTPLWATGGEVRFTRDTSRTSEVSVFAGARYVRDTTTSAALPLAGASGQSVFYQHGENRLEGTSSASLSPVLDIIQGRYRLGVTTNGALTYFMTRKWSASASYFAFVPVSPDPLVPPQDESVYGMDFPLTYRPDETIALRVGFRQHWRSPHPADGYVRNQVQTMGFVGVTVVETIARSRHP